MFFWIFFLQHNEECCAVDSDYIQFLFYEDAQQAIQRLSVLRLFALKKFTALYPWLRLTGHNTIREQNDVFRLYLLYYEPHC